jgi:hypothetical protein
MFARSLGLAFWMAIASIAGFWLNPQSGMLLGAFLVCLWVVLRDLWKGQKLTHWLRHNNVQDPPEMVVSLARILLEKPEHDAVLAVKKQSTGSLLLRIARRTYYMIPGYSSRLTVIPRGFHQLISKWPLRTSAGR